LLADPVQTETLSVNLRDDSPPLQADALSAAFSRRATIATAAASAAASTGFGT
jgi:hypothetical protein